MKALGVVANMQPAWLYLDGARSAGTLASSVSPTFTRIARCSIGRDCRRRLRSHAEDRQPSLDQPVQPVSRDVDDDRPAASRRDAPLQPEQTLTREQAIRFYTINNAFLTFEETQKGSLEPGKLADFIVLDRDILTCPVEQVKDIQVEATYLGGERVYARQTQ